MVETWSTYRDAENRLFMVVRVLHAVTEVPAIGCNSGGFVPYPTTVELLNVVQKKVVQVDVKDFMQYELDGRLRKCEIK